MLTAWSKGNYSSLYCIPTLSGSSIQVQFVPQQESVILRSFIRPNWGRKIYWKAYLHSCYSSLIAQRRFCIQMFVPCSSSWPCLLNVLFAIAVNKKRTKNQVIKKCGYWESILTSIGSGCAWYVKRIIVSCRSTNHSAWRDSMPACFTTLIQRLHVHIWRF